MSLGIGANVTCKSIYLPNLNKPSEGTFGAIDSSSLIQLINRAGRKLDILPNAFIYCTLKDYPRIDTAVKSKPDEFVSAIPFDQIKHKVKDKNSILQHIVNELF